jgi:hypothetical protein
MISFRLPSPLKSLPFVLNMPPSEMNGRRKVKETCICSTVHLLGRHSCGPSQKATQCRNRGPGRGLQDASRDGRPVWLVDSERSDSVCRGSFEGTHKKLDADPDETTATPFRRYRSLHVQLWAAQTPNLATRVPPPPRRLLLHSKTASPVSRHLRTPAKGPIFWLVAQRRRGARQGQIRSPPEPTSVQLIVLRVS